jgi:hypothetical protein
VLRGLSLLILVSLLVTISSAPLARADDFSFSFTNTISGNVSGTVTGIIRGLTNNTTGPATQVIITSFPAGLSSVLGPAPINAMLWDQQIQNSFTETNGVVTAGGFWAQDTIGGLGDGAQLYVDGGFEPYNFLNLDGADGLYVYGANGLAAANIKPLATSVPTLSWWATLMLAILLGASGLLLLNKYHKAA